MKRAPVHCDVAIVGAGPSGLAAATQLRKLGVNRVVVLEREAKAGGVPRHCGHPPFGMRELNRITTGPRYAEALAKRAVEAGVELMTSTSVVGIHPDAKLTFTDDAGLGELTAERVILATGIRETPRSARLISGNRPRGILTTGALQSMVYLAGKAPCQRPVIVGTELVSFSAILTCQHASIKPVAMIEENTRITARPFAALLPWARRIPVHTDTVIDRILGTDQVTGVDIRSSDGKQRRLDCDAVIFTGRFVPEASLCRLGHLLLDPVTGGPVVDQYGRCSDPSYYAAGNLLRPVETAGWCWQEGIQIANNLYESLGRPTREQFRSVAIRINDPAISWVVPQRIALDDARGPGSIRLQIRVSRPVSGQLGLALGGETILRRDLNTRPERRFRLTLSDNALKTIRTTSENLTIAIQADR